MIIFSADLTKQNICFSNASFFNLFLNIKQIPYNYLENDILNSVINTAIDSFYGQELSKITVEINNILYYFEIDKNQDRITFCGQKLDTTNRLKNTDVEKFLSLLANNLPDMLWAKDINGHYIFANEAICNNLLMAKNTNEVIGKTDVFFALRERQKFKDKKNWHTFGELCFNSDEVVLENMQAMRFEEYGNVKGKLLYLEVHKAPFFDENGRLLGTVGSGRDITKEVLAKRELEEKDKLMSQQAKMASMGEMIGNIAHQWRQPLSMINTLITTAMVERELGLLSEKELTEKLKSVQNTTEHLSKTIDDFRLFFKPNKEKEIVDLEDTFIKTLKLIHPKLKSNNIEIIKNLSAIKLKTLENELIQVIINIINNAEDILKEKKLKEKLIFLDLRQEKDIAIIQVKDNAGGINKEIINKIFEQYFTTKHQSQGTGIGLYMSQLIIRKHLKGAISVKNSSYTYKSNNYTGALFTITLPLKEE